MRTFIYYSTRARTSGNWKDLMKAGRMDIVCNTIISTFFISNKMRDKIHLHLIFNGPPNPPMHLEIISENSSKENPPISKKDIGGLIKRMLYKCKKDKRMKIFPGCFIEKKSFSCLIKELIKEGKRIYVLDSKGENIRKINSHKLENCVFILGDDLGIPKKEIKNLKERISIGKKIYFASQTMTIINNELDLREIY